MSVLLSTVVAHLDAILRIREIPDDARALNGLQVDGGGDDVSRVAVAVDACQASIDSAAMAGADLLIVHHGLFWGGLEPLTGRHGRRVRRLMGAGLSLYGAHNPLDLHPELGNNALLARDLGLAALEPFGVWLGVQVGFGGALSTTRAELARRIAARVGTTPQVIATGPEQVRRVAVVTGAGSSTLREARDAGYDTLVTGEAPHHAYFDAEEWGLNLMLAGHYATETIGVRALGQHLEVQFGLPWQFIDHPTAL